MTSERAQEILNLAYKRWQHSIPWAIGQAPITSRGGYICSNKPELHEHSRGMTKEEYKEIVKFWKTLPGSYCFFAALERLAQDETRRQS
jgi:hypothetical protein